MLSIAPRPVHVDPGRPVEVELGSAEAEFLFERALEDPVRQYVGVEIREKWVRQANLQARARGLTNVASVFANMSVDLPRLFPAGRLMRVHLNFPDPWWKTRQQKRRPINGELVATIRGLLAPRGELHVASDIFDLALEAMAALEMDGGFVNLAGSWTFQRKPPFQSRSRRERECMDKGAPIWRVAYRLA
jgi:tRNA (guanine-N7-)-methyltransferase